MWSIQMILWEKVNLQYQYTLCKQWVYWWFERERERDRDLHSSLLCELKLSGTGSGCCLGCLVSNTGVKQNISRFEWQRRQFLKVYGPEKLLKRTFCSPFKKYMNRVRFGCVAKINVCLLYSPWVNTRIRC